MSVVHFVGSAVDARALNASQRDEAASKASRNVGAVHALLRTLSPDPKFFERPKAGDAVGEWTATSDVEWSRGDKRVRAFARRKTSADNFKFFSPRPFVSSAHPGVLFVMDPKPLGSGVNGVVYALRASKHVDDNGVALPVAQCALKLMLCMRSDADGLADIREEVRNVHTLNAAEGVFADSAPAVVVCEEVRARAGCLAFGVVMELADGDLQQLSRKGPCSESTAAHIAYAMLQEIEHMVERTGLLFADTKPENFLYTLASADADTFTVSMADYGSLKPIGSTLSVTTYASPRTAEECGRGYIEATWAHVALCLAMCMLYFVRDPSKVEEHFLTAHPEFSDRARTMEMLRAWMFVNRNTEFGTCVAALLQWDGEDILPTQKTPSAEPRLCSAEDIADVFTAYFKWNGVDRRRPYPSPK